MNILVLLLSYVYPYKIIEYFRILNRLVKSKYMKRKFKRTGKSFRVFFPSSFKGEQYISVGDNFSLDKGGCLQCWEKYESNIYQPEIIIGNGAHLGELCHITAIRSIRIGDNLLTGRNVYISDHSHGRIDKNDIGIAPISRELYSKGDVVIGNDVWIGDNVCIMPGVHIGNNVIIGANAVVTHDTPDNCVVVGVPAKVIKIINTR